MEERDKRQQILAMIYQNMSRYEANQTVNLLDEYVAIIRSTSKHSK